MSNDDHELTEYEQQRLAHIKRNREYMARLGIVELASSLDKPKAPAKAKGEASRKRKPTGPPAVGERRSGRLTGVKPEYTEEIINDMGDELDRKAGRGPDKDSVDWSLGREEMLEETRRWLERVRGSLLGVGASAGHEPTCASEWQREAVQRWGDKCKTLQVSDWETYVCSRLSTPPPPSGVELLQEFYAHDTWQLLVVCILMSRVSSKDVKERAIAAFFEKYPTPSDAMDMDPDECLEIIHPLGLFPTRVKSLLAVTKKFLEEPEFELGLTPPHKVYGIGEFGYDSYLIFCKCDLACGPNDKALKSFVEWQKRHRKKQEAGDEGVGGAEEGAEEV